MNIIIAGAGEVGSHLAKMLSREANMLTIIDNDPNRLNKLSEIADVITVQGQPTSIETLKQAGAENADLFIADSWLRDNQDKRRKADTTLFLDPIFEDHKVDYKDFYVSIEYYTAHPEEYSDILTGAIDIIQERYEIISVLSEQYNLAEEVRKKLPKYHIINFGADSMKALGDRAFWHPDSLSVVDSIPQLDTLVRKDTLALTALDTLKASDKPLKPRNLDVVKAELATETKAEIIIYNQNASGEKRRISSD